MNKRGNSLIIAGGMLVLVIIGVVFVLVNIGKAYQGGLSFFSQNRPEASVNLQKKKAIRKITLQKNGSLECFEVTPDGVIRVYDTCDGNLTQASRLSNPKYILELFKKLSERNYTSTQTGTGYKIIIETDTGTEVIYLSLDEENKDIIETIENTIEDIPNSSPTLTPSSSSSFSPSPQASSNPTVSSPPSPSSEPESSNSPADNPFSCTFSEGGQNKPYRISNIVCSDEPQP